MTQPDQPDQLAARLRDYLREQMDRSPATAALLIELARVILAEADARAATPQTTHSTPQPTATQPAPTPAPPTPPAPEPLRRAVPLRIGDITIPVEVHGSEADLRAAEAAHDEQTDRDEHDDAPDQRDIDLAMIVQRARLKAASCLLYIERRAAEGDPERERPLVDQMKTMIDRAQNQLRDCFLWAFFRERTQPDDDTLRTIAACYESLAAAAESCHRATAEEWLCDEDTLHDAMRLLAEASSALRIALRSTWLTQPDRDQDETHLWLRTETWRRSIFVERYMSLDDPADPARAPELTAEAATLTALLDARQRDARRAEELINKVRYHARQLAADPGNEHHARTINTCAEEILAKGARPGDPRLAPIATILNPDHFPPSVPASDATRSILTPPPKPRPRAARVTETKPAPRQWSDRVLEARQLLREGNLVLIGGEPRPDAIARITEAFELTSVDWVPLTEHGTGAPMQAPIARPETKAVIVLIKLTGHLHAEEARAYARQSDKPCVLLPAGYNPEQIAEHLLNQAAERLN